MSFKRTIKSLAFGTAMLTVGSSAYADLITQWSFNTTAQWTNPVWEGSFPGGDSGGTVTPTPTTLSWGATGGNFVGANPNRSALQITGAPAMGTLVTNSGTPESTVVITHYNNELAGGTNSLLAATIETSLTLAPLVPGPGAAFPPDTTMIPIRFFETDNVTACGFPTVSNCDDIFIIAATDLENSFDFDGFTYTVRIVAPGLGPLPANTCAAAEVAAGCFGLTTAEGGANPIPFGLLISAREIAVPGPASLLLLGAGLFGLGAAGRARKQRA